MAQVMNVNLLTGETTIEEYVHIVEPTPIPSSVSSRQFKMQLLLFGIKDAVEAWVNSQSELVKIAYQESATFYRDDEMMKAGFAAMGFTKEQEENFWVGAASL